MISVERRAAAVFGAWRERIDRGESVDPEEVIRAHPDIAAALRRQFDALRLVARAFEGAGPAANAPHAAWLEGRKLGRWRLVSVLGSGGMGTVFLATGGDRHDRPRDERAAVKVLHPHLLARRGFVERFRREAEIGARVRHANVVATLEAGSALVGGHAVNYLVMEHVEGRTLRALLDETVRLPEALCRHVGRETARALAAIHAAGAVHRDLKPDNVIITPDHAVKVMDLGVAQLRDEAVRLSQTGAFVGSVQYGSPEQFRDPESVDARADLHALGLVLYELATGVHPFRADGFHTIVRRVLDETPRPASELNPQLSPFFEELVRTLLEKDRERRFASAEEVAGALDAGEESAWWRERSAAIRAETRRPLRRIRIPRETAVHGREVELASLRALYEEARAGDGRVVLVEGEAGIGKSRLVDELVGRLAQSGEEVNFLVGSYPPGGAATASGAFATAFREHLGDDESSVRAALPQTPLLAPAFTALLRGDSAAPGTEPLTKDSLHSVFVHATRSFAATRPTIVLIDDLHFAPDEGRALFAALALALPGHRILLVGATRPGLDAKWLAQIERLGHSTRMPLARLSPKDLVRLLADSLKSTHVAEELAGKIAVKSDGNPFFVFEILRGLREGQFITKRSDGTWATTREIREIEVPSSVVDLVQARVSDLSRADRNVLEVASCVGFEFDAALVGDVLKIERIPLLQLLGAIEKSHRLVRSVGRRFVFDHHQVMEVLYTGLSEPLREEYHAAIGAAIEAKSGAAAKTPDELDGALRVELADHLLKGGQGPRAIQYFDAALKHLERSHAVDAGVRLISRALSVPGLVAGRARCDLLLWKSSHLDLFGLNKGGRSDIDEALALADQDGDGALRANARHQLGVHLFRLARHDDAIALFLEARDLARAVGERKCERQAIGNLGICYHCLGRATEAREHAEQCLALAVEAGDLISEARAADNLGMMLNQAGRYADAREHLERSLAVARRAGHRQAEVNARGNMSCACRPLGRFDEAREHTERALAVSREIGYRQGEAASTGQLGNICDSLGRFAESLGHSGQWLRLAQELGDRHGEATALANLGQALYCLGRIDEAREHCERCLSVAREIRSRSDEGFALRSLARLAAEEGDFATADRRFAEALEIRRSIEELDGEAETLRAQGAWRLHLGRDDEASAAFGHALEIARGLALPGVEVLATAGLAALPGGDVVGALAALSTHASRLEVRAAMEARFLLWRSTDDIAHLAEARRLLDHVVEHAPAADRETMLANVRLHREIAEAARANSV